MGEGEKASVTTLEQSWLAGGALEKLIPKTDKTWAFQRCLLARLFIYRQDTRPNLQLRGSGRCPSVLRKMREPMHHAALRGYDWSREHTATSFDLVHSVKYFPFWSYVWRYIGMLRY